MEASSSRWLLVHTHHALDSSLPRRTRGSLIRARCRARLPEQVRDISRSLHRFGVGAGRPHGDSRGISWRLGPATIGIGRKCSLSGRTCTWVASRQPVARAHSGCARGYSPKSPCTLCIQSKAKRTKIAPKDQNPPQIRIRILRLGRIVESGSARGVDNWALPRAVEGHVTSIGGFGRCNETLAS